MMKAKKLTVIFLVVLMVLTAVTGCSPQKDQGNSGDSNKDDGKLTIGFSVITQNFPYYVSMLDGFKAACDTKGWDYIWTEAGMDVEKTVNDCSDLIQKGVDALVIASWYGDSLADVFAQCKEAGIPVFLIDTGSLPPDGDYVTNIGTVDFDAGYAAGYWAAKYLKDQGKSEVNYITFTTATTVGRNRVDGFIQGLKDSGEKVGLTAEQLNEYLGDTRESYMASCEDALTTYPKLDLIFAANAQGGLGSYDACVAAGRKEVNIIGYDSEADEMKLIDQGTQYIASVKQQPYEMAQQTIQNIEDYLYNGATFEKSTPFDSNLYTVDGLLTKEDIIK